MPIHAEIPTRAMAIFAHPDDIEFSVAGTVAGWVRAGCRVAYVLVTSGDVGIAEPGMTKERAVAIREAEQRAAAAVVGVTDVTFLREPDGMVEPTIALRKRLVRELRRFRPEAVLTSDPSLVFVPSGGINHPDHRAVGTAAIDAVFPAAGQPNLFEELADEGLTARKIRRMYISSRGEGDHWVDITDTVELKIQALQAHHSQLDAFTGLDERIRAWSAAIAARGREAHPDVPEARAMRHAEAFRLVPIIPDQEWADILDREAAEAAAAAAADGVITTDEARAQHA